MTGTALVTGAGRGLGAAIARTLGAVAVNDPRPADDVVAGIRAAGGTAVAAPGDVTDDGDVTRLVAAVTGRLGPVGCLVANATGPQPVAGLADLTWRAHLDQLEFFVKSPTLLAQAVVPGMRAAGGGRIVHIGLDMPDRALPGWSAYAAVSLPPRRRSSPGSACRSTAGTACSDQAWRGKVNSGGLRGPGTGYV